MMPSILPWPFFYYIVRFIIHFSLSMLSALLPVPLVVLAWRINKFTLTMLSSITILAFIIRFIFPRKFSSPMKLPIFPFSIINITIWILHSSLAFRKERSSVDKSIIKFFIRVWYFGSWLWGVRNFCLKF